MSTWGRAFAGPPTPFAASLERVTPPPLHTHWLSSPEHPWVNFRERHRIIARDLQKTNVPDFIEESTRILLRIRPQANPNVLVLTRGLQLLLPPAAATAAARTVHQDSRFSRNPAVD